MRKLLRNIAIFSTVGGAALLAPGVSSAAPNQIVVVVAEGLSPQAIDIGADFVKSAGTAAGGEEAPSALSDLKTQAKMQETGATGIASMRGVLSRAASRGYRTGLVTTGEVAQVAPLFYDVPADGAASTLLEKRGFDFLAGGGRAAFSALDAGAKMKAGGGTALLDSEAIEDTGNEIKGKTLALASEGELSYSIDNDNRNETGLGALSGIAMDALAGENDAPFVLVIHDTLLARALRAKDTPAVLAELGELDSIVADVMGRRAAKEKPDALAIALVATGDAPTPRFLTASAIDRSNVFFVVSSLPYSYNYAGELLKGADAKRLDAFATEEYKGWKLSESNRAAIAAGTLTPEAALRASYEPSIALGYDEAAPVSTLHTLGLEVNGDLVQTLDALPAVPAK